MVPTALPPLTWATVAQSWCFDAGCGLGVAVLAVGYGWALRRARRGGQPTPPGRVWCFGIGLALWVLASMSVIGVYAAVLFWMRALQVLLMLLVVPFFLAAGTPLSVLRGALDAGGRDRFDRLLATPAARVLVHPLTTSIAMLAVPWLLYLTPWYTASLTNSAIGGLTRILLLLIGFGYFYARLQVDPVPRRYSQLISLVITIFETIGDGVLGLVLWQGPLIAADYYLGLHRFWGPSLRLDQTIGAGVLWILGDVLGVPFLVVLLRALSADERVRAREVDAELDSAEQIETEQPTGSTLWWENDPELRERFRRR
jgi:cytochrome c oxidase assembly factor CtaG